MKITQKDKFEDAFGCLHYVSHIKDSNIYGYTKFFKDDGTIFLGEKVEDGKENGKRWTL